MKRILFFALSSFCFLIGSISFQVDLVTAQDLYYQNGYYRKDGTYVQGHYKTRPDGNKDNNLNTTSPTYDQNGNGVNDRYEMYKRRR